MIDLKVCLANDCPELVIVGDILAKLGATIHQGLDCGPVDAVVWSSQIELELRARVEASGAQILCEITGGTDPLFMGNPSDAPVLSEQQMQACTGLLDVTGPIGGDPVASKVPYVALSTALYAVSAVLAAAIEKRRDTDSRFALSASRHLTALNALTTFLPAGLLGKPASRIGNGHTASAPWGSYRAKDGWFLLCTSKEEQWNKLVAALDLPSLRDPRFAVQADRVANRQEIDALIEEWSQTQTVVDAVERLTALGIPAGPITRMCELTKERNIALRQPAFVQAHDAGASERAQLAAVNLFESTLFGGQSRQWVNEEGRGPLSGLRVIEIGQFTTVPLAGRHLAYLGADVLKIEPLGGEPTRGWQPSFDGVSHYYTITNADKRRLELNLRDEQSRAWLHEQVAQADILIENMRPGVLAQFGLGPTDLVLLNPGLIACSVSGFGIHTAYPKRAAFDTVIQAMSGVMDMTRGPAGPVKMGISTADILGAQFTLMAVLAALLDGSGRNIDISMQDCGLYAAMTGAAQLCPFDEPGEARSVLEIAQHPEFITRCMGSVRDEQGIDRPAVKIPYQISRI